MARQYECCVTTLYRLEMNGYGLVRVSFGVLKVTDRQTLTDRQTDRHRQTDRQTDKQSDYYNSLAHAR